jgi:hypothetical protein
MGAGIGEDGGRMVAAVREAVGAIASSDIRDRILDDALELAGIREVPPDPSALRGFVESALADAVDAALGAGSGALVVDSLRPILQRAASTRPPPGHPERPPRSLAPAFPEPTAAARRPGPLAPDFPEPTATAPGPLAPDFPKATASTPGPLAPDFPDPELPAREELPPEPSHVVAVPPGTASSASGEDGADAGYGELDLSSPADDADDGALELDLDLPTLDAPAADAPGRDASAHPADGDAGGFDPPMAPPPPASEAPPLDAPEELFPEPVAHPPSTEADAPGRFDSGPTLAAPSEEVAALPLPEARAGRRRLSSVEFPAANDDGQADGLPGGTPTVPRRATGRPPARSRTPTLQGLPTPLRPSPDEEPTTILFATSDPIEVADLEQALAAAAGAGRDTQLVHVSDSIELLDAAREVGRAGHRPVLVLSGRTPSVTPVTIAAMAPELPEGFHVVVWGRSAEVDAASEAPQSRRLAWTRFDSMAPAGDVAHTCVELLRTSAA